MSTFDKLDALHARATDIFQRAIAHGGGCACGIDCPACCREPVYASRLEAERIVATLTEEDKAAIIPKLKDWLAAFYGVGHHQAEQPNVYKYVPTMPPCVLLKGTRCGVYDHRPVECRAHFAFKHRSYCEDLEKRKQQAHAKFSDGLLVSIMSEQMLIEGHLLVDHLCVHLAEILIGPQPETQDRVQYIVK